MESNPLRQQIANMRQSFFDEEILDKHFVEMERLEDNENPNFAEEVMTMYFRDSTKLIAALQQALDKPPYDLTNMDKYLHQLKGSSASVGAKKVWIELNHMKQSVKEGDMESSKSHFEQVKREHATLREKVEPYFQMVRQVGPPETAQPPM